MRVGSVQIRADTNFARGAAGVPLTVAEERAYATIGSSRYLEKEMRPQACGHASFLPKKRWMPNGKSGYSTGVERVASSAVIASSIRSIHGRLNLGLRAEHQRSVARRYESELYGESSAPVGGGSSRWQVW